MFDVRATVIEVVSRWVNLQHLDQLPVYEKQLVALEALQIYAPLGHAVGVGPISAQMEDESFKVTDVKCSCLSCLLCADLYR